jgi:hypothetical protein
MQLCRGRYIEGLLQLPGLQKLDDTLLNKWVIVPKGKSPCASKAIQVTAPLDIDNFSACAFAQNSWDIPGVRSGIGFTTRENIDR